MHEPLWLSCIDDYEDEEDEMDDQERLDLLNENTALFEALQAMEAERDALAEQIAAVETALTKTGHARYHAVSLDAWVGMICEMHNELHGVLLNQAAPDATTQPGGETLIATVFPADMMAPPTFEPDTFDKLDGC